MIAVTEALGIKPCPFCGEYPMFWDEYDERFVSFTDRDDCRYYIECVNVGCACNPCTILFKTKEEAIEAWNKRVKETEE